MQMGSWHSLLLIPISNSLQNEVIQEAGFTQPKNPWLCIHGYWIDTPKPEIKSWTHILEVAPLLWLVMIWDSTWMGLRLTKNILMLHPNDSRTTKDS